MENTRENKPRKTYNNNSSGQSGFQQNRRFKPFKKKFCKFCSEGVVWIDYKNVDLLEQYTTDRGKIIPGKITGACAKHQRQIGTAIKVLRNLALLPYTTVKYKLRPARPPRYYSSSHQAQNPEHIAQPQPQHSETTETRNS